MKKAFALLFALMMFVSLAACGGPSAAQSNGASQAAGSGQGNAKAPEEPEHTSPFPVPTEGQPPAVRHGVNMANIVPDGCTKLVYRENMFFCQMASEPSVRALVDYFNEKVMPEIEAISDDGRCLVDDDSGSDVLGIGSGIQVYRAFDSIGYEVSDGNEYTYSIADGKVFGWKQPVSNHILLRTRYVYDGVLYQLIADAGLAEEPEICVMIFEEYSQKFRIIG